MVTMGVIGITAVAAILLWVEDRIIVRASPRPNLRVGKLHPSIGGIMDDLDAFRSIVAELRSDRSWSRRVRRIEATARFRAWCWRALSSAGLVAGAGILT
jgi:hypothetical protein